MLKKAEITTGRKQFEQLYNAYEKYRTNREIPATWDIIYGVAVK